MRFPFVSRKLYDEQAEELRQAQQERARLTETALMLSQSVAKLSSVAGAQEPEESAGTRGYSPRASMASLMQEANTLAAKHAAHGGSILGAAPSQVKHG